MDLDSNIEEVNAIPENYARFVKLLRMASRKHIQRGCRSNYIPGLTDEYKSLYEGYRKQYSMLLLYALFNHPRLLIQVARVQKAQFSYRLDGLVP